MLYTLNGRKVTVWNCTVETTPLNVGCDYMSYPFVLKNIFCVVYDATFCCFLLDKRSFFIDCAGFWDKTVIFAV